MARSFFLMIALFITVGVIVFEFRGCFQKSGIMQLGSLTLKPSLNNYDTLTIAEMKKYRKEMKSIILTNSQTIYELKSRAKAMPDRTQVEYLRKIDGLEQKNTELRKKIRTYTISGADNWNEFKSEFSRDIYSLGNAFKDLAASSAN
jgi:hypothetical protein